MKNKDGFTLVELIGVIIIIGLLLGLLIPVASDMIEDSRKNAFRESLRSIVRSTEVYMEENELKKLPPEGITLDDLSSNLDSIDNFQGVVKYQNGKVVLKNINNGSYCGNGTIDNLLIKQYRKEDCIYNYAENDGTKHYLMEFFDMENNEYINEGFHDEEYYDKIISVNFVNYIDISNAVESWDLSEEKDESIIGWAEYAEDSKQWYNFYVGSSGSIYANPNSNFLFFLLINVISYNFDNFVTSDMEEAIYMFYYNNSLFSLDLNEWDVSNLTNAMGMFAFTGLTSLNISNWDTSSLTIMDGMFGYSKDLIEFDVSNLNISNVISMQAALAGLESLEEINVSNWDTSNVTDMSGLFANNTSLKELDLSSFKTSNVTDMSGMFDGSSSLIKLDLSNLDTSNVTNMASMFRGASSIRDLDLSHFNTSKVTYMNYMFYNATSLKSLNISSFNTSKVTDMSSMFRNCYRLSTLDLTSFDTHKVKEMNEMFEYTISLSDIYVTTGKWVNAPSKRLMFSNSNGKLVYK